MINYNAEFKKEGMDLLKLIKMGLEKKKYFIIL